MFLTSAAIAETLDTHDTVQALEIASSGLKITTYHKSADGTFFQKGARRKFSFHNDKPGENFTGQLWSAEADENGKRALTQDAQDYLARHFVDAVNHARANEIGMIAYSTSPLRNASNAQKVRQFLENASDIKIGVISGIEEGIMEAVALHGRKPYITQAPCRYAVLGIGGGSTQFFRFTKNGWKFAGLDVGMKSEIPPAQAYELAYQGFEDIERNMSRLNTLYVIGNGANKSFLEMSHFNEIADGNKANFSRVKKRFEEAHRKSTTSQTQTPNATKIALVSGLLARIDARDIIIMRHVYPSDGIFGYHGYGLQIRDHKRVPTPPRIDRRALAHAI